MKPFLLALAFAWLVCVPARGAELRVGFAEVDLTPELTDDRPIWIAGYGHGRRATSVHDPILARCAVLSDGDRTFALAGVDLVGLQLPQVEAVRARLPGIDHLIVGSSHNHEGPDVIGIWGRTPVKRGVDEQYLADITEKISGCILEAKSKLARAEASFGTADDTTLLGDGRLPEAFDPTLRLLKFSRPGEEAPLGLILQWNCHPEAMGAKNTALTADFPAATVAALQREHRCPVVYLTGAVGGLMAPPAGRVLDGGGEILKEGDFEYARLYGEAVAGLANKALAAAKPISLTPFKSYRRELYIPVRNPYYRAAVAAGVLARDCYIDTGDPSSGGKPFGLKDTFRKMALRTEVNALRLGELDVIGIPGEIYPELIYGMFQDPAEAGVDFPEAQLESTVDEIFSGRKWMLVGLANDEIGYIIPKRQWDHKKPYAYGRDTAQYGELNSCSPEVAPILMKCLQAAATELGQSTTTVRVLSHNVWYGFTKKPVRKTAWLNWTQRQQADIIALQELNGYSEEQLATDATSWGHGHSALLKEDGFSTGLTSRFPITGVARLREGFHHGLLRCKTNGLVVYVIHFHPSDWQFRIRETKLLLDDVSKLSAEDQGKVIFIGDFNSLSPRDQVALEEEGELERFFAALDKSAASNNLRRGKLDYSGIEALQENGYLDLVYEQEKGLPHHPGTFPTKLRRDEQLGRERRLDYAFMKAPLAKDVTRAQVLRDETTATLSDHYPIVIDLTMP